MDTLDEDEIDRFIAARPVGMDEAPPSRPIRWRRLVMVLLILVLGGGLGTVGYFVSNMDTRDVIAALDVADRPQLSIQLPGRDGKEAEPAPSGPTNPGGLLTPPGGVAAPPPPEPPAAPAITPPPVPAPPVAPAVELPAVPPPVAAPPPAPVNGANGKTNGHAAPPAPPPPVVAAPAPSVAGLTPATPTPRPADQLPTFASLPVPAAKPVALAPAPVETLLRQSPNGPLPVIGQDGKQAWKVYARPWDAASDKIRMAVMVVGLGMDKEATDAAITKTPADMTLVFSPYASGLDKLIKRARDAGHEVMVALPVEMSGFPARDPGPLGLMVTTPPEEIIARLEKVLARAPGAVGVWAADGPFTRSKQVGLVLAALKDRGLLYVGDGGNGEPKPPMAALAGQLDAEPYRNAIEARQIQASEAAKEMGRAVVAINARPISFDRLLGWMDKFPDHNIVLAPVSSVVKP
ncbi:conserved hypothetical protein [Magnetospirillum sp. LM-5]|uniref:divergent polysaccharide deacetylase family protein n=1 Tax=Magnetospirillum sp. LM-5 TaxID=2681466 RepID=UPI0013831456|nr:divergent polysaccharide deacetylase family protein [Magnetospirillum sp. LM-5]CAA7621137.1 conserved hypothetical protein [Magnetospirillum sp. LM-5]